MGRIRSDEITLHIWSNGDISLECGMCPPTTNYWDYRTNTRHWGLIDNLLGEERFVGCKECKRGASIKIRPMRFYQFSFRASYVKISWDFWTTNKTPKKCDWKFLTYQERKYFKTAG